MKGEIRSSRALKGRGFTISGKGMGLSPTVNWKAQGGPIEERARISSTNVFVQYKLLFSIT